LRRLETGLLFIDVVEDAAVDTEVSELLEKVRWSSGNDASDDAVDSLEESSVPALLPCFEAYIEDSKLSM
jgi:hypothetical protein